MKLHSEKEKKSTEDILLHEKKDRRLLPDVPSVSGRRQVTDRRGHLDKNETFEERIKRRQLGIRYIEKYPVQVRAGKTRFTAESIDISQTGMAIQVSRIEKEILDKVQTVHLKFHVVPGTMPEGFEMNINTTAKVVRTAGMPNGHYQIGLQFTEDLSEYARKKKDRYTLMVSSMLLLFISLFIVLMRSESVIYLKFNLILYLYSITTAVFLLSRYLFGALYRPKLRSTPISRRGSRSSSPASTRRRGSKGRS